MARRRGRKRHLQLGMLSSTGTSLTLGGKQAGKRTSPGRPPKNRRAGASHATRPALARHVPLHVVIRVAGDFENLRTRAFYKALRSASLVVLPRTDFQIVHISIQRLHVHLLVEADDRHALANGMRAFQISAAKHLNRAASTRRARRTGRVFTDRYFAEPITNRRQAHRALGYVLNNWRKHREDLCEVAQGWYIDPFSTATSFEGWKERSDIPAWPATYQSLAVRRPRTWLLRLGWELYGPLSCFDVPSQPVTARR